MAAQPRRYEVRALAALFALRGEATVTARTRLVAALRRMTGTETLLTELFLDRDLKPTIHVAELLCS